MIKEILSASFIFDFLGKRSFAQCGEDLVLRHLFGSKKGFYVDIGAYHPKRLSNTYLLYRQGWRGVTIEPNPDVASLFAWARPNDTHLSCGIGARSGKMKYFEFADRTRNTFDEKQVKEYERAGYTMCAEREIEVMSVTNLLKTLPERDIDVLSIDCEGMDREILTEWDFDKYQPKVMVIEDDHDLTNFLTKKGYHLSVKLPFSGIWVCDKMLVA